MKRFMIFGSFSGTNAGDTAVLYAIIHQLERRYPGSVYYVPTTVPTFFQKQWVGPKGADVRPISMRVRHGAYGFISAKTLVSIIQCDAVFTTANMFFDLNLFSPWNNLVGTLFPVLCWYRLFKPGGFIVAAAISANKPTTKLGKHILHLSLSLHNLIIVRDSKSIDILNQLGIKKDRIPICHDVVFGKIACGSDSAYYTRRPRIGINLSTYFSGELIRPRQLTIDEWVRGITAFIIEAERRKWTTHFVLTSSTDRWLAKLVCKQSSLAIPILDPGKMSFQDICCEINSLDAYVTMRMHGAIFALNCSTPIFGLCFTEKLHNFFSEQQLERSMFDLRRIRKPPIGFEKALADRIAGFLESPPPPRQPTKGKDPFPLIFRSLESNQGVR
jgi:polysaccharide pyruvyl transferase WcaK-like protein